MTLPTEPGVDLSDCQTVVGVYLEAIKTRGARPKTVRTYRTGLGSFATFLAAGGIVRFQDVCLADLERYQLSLIRRDLKPASQDLYVRSVRGLFHWLETTHRIFASPANDKPVRARSPLQPVPSEVDIARLLDQPDTRTALGIRDRALLETAYSTGARREELTILELQSVDLAEGTLRVFGKGAKERVVPLGRQAVAWLTRYLTQARPRLVGHVTCTSLWLERNGRPLGYAGLRDIVRRHAVRARLTVPLTPHSLRRACATHMLRGGAHPAQIRQLLGHANFRSLDRYLRLAVTDLKSAHARTSPGQ